MVIGMRLRELLTLWNPLTLDATGLRAVILIVAFSSALSAGLSIVIRQQIQGEISIPSLIIAILMPFVLAPLGAIPAFNLVVRLRHQEQDLRQAIEKQKFLFALVGHELRSPVAAINMLSAEEGSEWAESKEDVHELSENLMDILEDLRVVLAPENAFNHSVVEAVPQEVVERSLKVLQHTASKNGIELEWQLGNSGGETYQFSAKSLRQVLNNLVKNSAIHSGGSLITVNFSVHSGSGASSKGVLTVQDDGKGVPPAFQASIFEPFERAGAKASGSGLGLYISAKLAEGMGGSLKYFDVASGGAQFVLTFPLQAASEIASRSVLSS
jgi:signal transduction histidine kinase